MNTFMQRMREELVRRNYAATTIHSLVVVWAAGVVVQAVWYLICHLALVRLRRSSKTIDNVDARHLLTRLTSHPPQLRSSGLVSSPFLAGIIHPVIYLPDALVEGMTTAQMEVVIAHEIAHLKRGDNVWTLAVRMVSMALWLNPLIHVLAREMEDVAEQCCDAAVLAGGTESQEYATVILDIAASYVSTRTEAAFGAGVTSHGSFLKRRIEAILAGTVSTTVLGRGARAVIGSVVAVLTVVAGSVLAVVRNVDPPAKPWHADPSYLAHFAVDSHSAVAPVMLVSDFAMPGPDHFDDVSRRWTVRNPAGLPIIDDEAGRTLGSLRDAANNLEMVVGWGARSDVEEGSAYREQITRYIAGLEKPAHPGFMAENTLGTCYLENHDARNADIWLRRALDDAPCVAVGRMQQSDGAPIAGRVFSFAIDYYPSLMESSPDVTHRAVVFTRTDADGRYALPLYRSIYSIDSWFSQGDSLDERLLGTDQTHAASVIVNRVGVVPPIVMRPAIHLTGAPFSGSLFNDLHPAVIRGNNLTLTWDPVPGGADYSLELGEQLSAKDRVVNGHQVAGGAGDFHQPLHTTTACSLTMQFDKTDPLFNRSAIYEGRIKAHLHADGTYAVSDWFTFQPADALAPIPATVAALSPYAPPGVHVDSVIRSGAVVKVEYTEPNGYATGNKPWYFAHKEWFGLTYTIDAREDSPDGSYNGRGPHKTLVTYNPPRLFR